MSNFLNKVFDNFGNNSSSLKENSNYNIEKISHDKYVVTLAVPGYKKEDLKVSFNKEGILNITGIKKTNTNEQSRDYMYRGFNIESFENNFSLSKRLKIIEANLYNGILNITLRDKTSDKNIISPINKNKK